MEQRVRSEYLNTAMTIGEQLLMAGGEVSRVEDAIRRILLSTGAVRVDVFSITSSIITTVHWPDGRTDTETRRITMITNDLDRLDRLNSLSRKICSSRMNPIEIRRELRQIDIGQSRYSFQVQLLSYALVSGAFCLFFGGSWGDMIAAALIGAVLKVLEAAVRRRQVNALLTILVISLAGGVLSRLSVMAGLASRPDLVSYGNIMLFIPGMAFTNSLRDLFVGDTITGAIRLLESLLLAVVIAAGFILARYLF
jgi:uncharacterized membrane protein YjjP (DUF1212 family)